VPDSEDLDGGDPGVPRAPLHGHEQGDADDVGGLLGALGGDALVEEHEERRPVPVDPLDPGTGHDRADADGAVGGNAGGEVGAHGGTEVPLEAGRAEGEDPGQIGVEAPVVEGGHGHAEGTDERGGAGRDLGQRVAAPEGHHLEHQRGGEGEGDAERGHTAAEEAHDARVTRGVRAAWAVAAVLALAVALAGVALARRGQTPAERRDDALEASRRFALALSAYDYRRLDRDVAEVRALSTGTFREQYDRALDGTAREALRDNEAVATARVLTGPLLARLGEDDARTFTVLEQRVRTKGAAAQVRRTRVDIVLVHTSQGWKADRVEVS
jgi:Mce-associated membrane protein